MIERTIEEIDAMTNKASDAANEPSKLHGMTYEQGVSAAFEWLAKLAFEDCDPVTGDIIE